MVSAQGKDDFPVFRRIMETQSEVCQHGLGRVFYGFQGLSRFTGQIVKPVLHERQIEVVLVPVIKVEPSHADPGFFRDHPHARTLVAVFGEYPDGCSEYPFPGLYS